MPAPHQQDDQSVVSGRLPSSWLGYAVLGVLALGVGVGGVRAGRRPLAGSPVGDRRGRGA